ncbi:MAG: hypothetical protein ACLFP2_05385 [Candidatus Woesearchaeota archaeon]
MYADSPHVVYHFDKCDYLTVNVTSDLPIDKEEYWFLGCNKIKGNHWSCDCTDDYDLTINTKISTINTYHLLMEYEVQNQVQRTSASTFGGDYVCHFDCKDWGPYIGGTQYRSCSYDCPASLAPSETRDC